MAQSIKLKDEVEIIPVALVDQLRPTNNIRTRTFFIIEECLEQDALKSSLDCLIRDHWQKLGGRLRSQSRGNLLEYHVPKTFGRDSVLFRWSCQEYNNSIDSVAQAIRAPPQDKGPVLLPSMKVVDSWFRPADWPYHRSDESPDDPLLFVHLSAFFDATVICISMPHVLADQMGLANIIKAWMGLLDGKEPSPMIGYDNDVLPGNHKVFADYPKKETYQKGRQRLFRTGEYQLVMLPFISDIVFNAEEDPYIIFFPLRLIQSLRQRHSKILGSKYADFSRISDGDIITAIVTKFARMNKGSPRTVALSQTINLRGKIFELDEEQRDAYIHNCPQYATSRQRLDHSTSIGEIAYANRRAIEKAAGSRGIEIGMAVKREMVRRGQANHICEPFERSYYVSNWCAAWKDLDFGPAVKNGGSVERKKPKFLVLGQAGERKSPRRYSSFILSRTEEGYWVDFSTSTAAMRLVREYLARDPNLEHF